MRNQLRNVLPVIAISLILIMAAMLYYSTIVYKGTINQIDSNFRSHIGHAATGFDGSPARSITALEHINFQVMTSRDYLNGKSIRIRFEDGFEPIQGDFVGPFSS